MFNAKYKIVDSLGSTKYLFTNVLYEEYKDLCDRAGYATNQTSYVTEYPDGSIGLLVAYDGTQSIENVWIKQTDKIALDGSKVTKYYQTTADNTDLPYNGTGWENGVITERYIFKDIVGDELIPLEGITFKQELTTFAEQNNIDLPPHDINDSKIFQVSVDYDGETPIKINYHINQMKK